MGKDLLQNRNILWNQLLTTPFQGLTSSQAWKLGNFETTTHHSTEWLTGVKCRATGVALKKISFQIFQESEWVGHPLVFPHSPKKSHQLANHLMFCSIGACYSPSGSGCSFFNIANRSLKLDAKSELKFWIFPWKNFQNANPVKIQLKLNLITEVEVWGFPARQRRRSSQFQVISVICFCPIFTVELRDKNMLGTKLRNYS